MAWAGWGCHPPEAGEVTPVDVEACLGPLPAGRQLVSRGPEPVGGELVEKGGIGEPDAALVLVREQVAVDDPTGVLIGLDTDEASGHGGGGHPVLGEHALDLPAAGPVALLPDLLPRRHLTRAIGGDGEGLEDLEVDLVGAVGIEQLGRGIAEAKALLDDALGHAEAGGDVGDRGAVMGQRAEGLHLIGGVHGDADHVLGERQLVVGGAVVDDPAGHGVVAGQHILGDEVGQRGEAPAAGDDGVAVRTLLAGAEGADDEVLEQAVSGDGGLELGEGGLAGRGPADVGRELQAVERDGADDGVGHERVSRAGWMGRGPDTLCGIRPSTSARRSARPPRGEHHGPE